MPHSVKWLRECVLDTFDGQAAFDVVIFKRVNRIIKMDVIKSCYRRVQRKCDDRGTSDMKSLVSLQQ